MLRVVLIRPGATDFDEQRRIKGSLDIPMNENGNHQVAQAADELASLGIDQIYTSPCQSAQQTADALGRRLDVKVKQHAGVDADGQAQSDNRHDREAGRPPKGSGAVCQIPRPALDHSPSLHSSHPTTLP